MTEVESRESEARRAAFRRFIAGVRQLAAAKKEAAGRAQEAAKVAAQAEEAVELCCQGTVHIAYRGMADDRMYVSYSRKWAELRFFRPNGLRVFCADCRQRLL
jgi:hypothetical protein